ncbi:MAG: YfgM family protein [Kiritimatiellia bacterium]
MPPKKDLQNLQHAQDIPEELANLKEWWNANGNIVTIVLIVILLCVLGIRQFKTAKASRIEKISTEYLASSDATGFETIIQENKSDDVVAMARLRLASLYYFDNKISLAATVYQDFLNNHVNHPMMDVALDGLAHCMEAQGKIDEAIAGYSRLTSDYPQSFLVADAIIGKARCLFLKDTEESKREGKSMLDLFLTENARSDWAEFADETLRAKDRLKVITPKEQFADIEKFLSDTKTDAAVDAAVKTAEATSEKTDTTGDAADTSPIEAAPIAPAQTEPAPAAASEAALEK